MINVTRASPTLLNDLERYWREVRGARHLPARTDVDPACIDAALPYSFILERIAPGIGRMRVAGQRINEFLGMEARGLPLCSLFDSDSKDQLQGYLEQVFMLPALVDLPIASSWGFGRPRLDGRLLLLPLLDGAGRVTRALGAIRAEGIPGRVPRTFELCQTGAVRIENVADMPAVPPARSLSGELPASAFANPRLRRLVDQSALTPPPPAPVPLHPAERPYLRLVVSNE